MIKERLLPLLFGLMEQWDPFAPFADDIGVADACGMVGHRIISNLLDSRLIDESGVSRHQESSCCFLDQLCCLIRGGGKAKKFSGNVPDSTFEPFTFRHRGSSS